MTNYREILRLEGIGISGREIARSLGVSRNTVAKVCKAAAEKGVRWPLDASATNAVLQERLFPKAANEEGSRRRLPDYERVRKELLRNGVTRKLLWTEYLEECRREGSEPLMYSQFCHYIQRSEEQRRASMHIPRRPGERIEVDWAGDPATLKDPDTGAAAKAWVFVGVMSYSQYAYAEAFADEKEEAWITAHVHMFRFFGGVAKTLVPDNAPTAVDHSRSDWYSPRLVRAYQEMAEHYGTAVIPARVRTPKDKPNAEGCVRNISTWITAALRDGQFFSLRELNEAVREKLEAYNTRPFQKKDGSRRSMFLGEEKPLLLPLPATEFEPAVWKQATVQFNYHVAVDKMYYSVPYQYIKERVDVRLTERTVEVFLRGARIASHKRLYGRPGQYDTIEDHMPRDHRQYLEWDGDRFRRWADETGPHARAVIDAILSSGKIEQQTYRACMGVMQLARKHGGKALEAACAKALCYTARPSYKSVKAILRTLTPRDIEAAFPQPVEEQPSYAITRGARHYEGR